MKAVQKPIADMTWQKKASGNAKNATLVLQH